MFPSLTSADRFYRQLRNELMRFMASTTLVVNGTPIEHGTGIIPEDRRHF